MFNFTDNIIIKKMRKFQNDICKEWYIGTKEHFHSELHKATKEGYYSLAYAFKVKVKPNEVENGFHWEDDGIIHFPDTLYYKVSQLILPKSIANCVKEDDEAFAQLGQSTAILVIDLIDLINGGYNFNNR